MTATRKDIVDWLEEAKTKGATHLIVAVDTYDHDNYPVMVMPGESCRDRVETICHSDMQGVDEVYDMSMDLQAQLREHRARHIPDDSRLKRSAPKVPSPELEAAFIAGARYERSDRDPDATTARALEEAATRYAKEKSK